MNTITNTAPAFEQWWEREGQYCRAGGGEYEKTFAYRAWSAAQPPAGWKLVPVEPTPEMLDAAAHASMQHLLDCIKDPERTEELGSVENIRKTHASRYRSMLAAAPKEAKAEPTKDVEQAAFEAWFHRVCPGGDVESVHRQWEESADYLELHDPTPMQPERAPLIHQQIERAAQKLADVTDYPWQSMPEEGKARMRKQALAILEAAYGEPAHKEQP